jgi:thioredoxin reductase (NADPH)
MRLADGTELGVDAWFHAGHPRPRSAVAAALGARCDGDGWVAVSTEQRTSAPGVYAAGDVTRLHSHQIATAVHEGAQAASAVNADLTAGVLGPG